MGDENDPWVKTKDGQIMRMSQFLAIQNQQLNDYAGKMTADIEQLSGLSNALYGEASEVWSLRWQLDSDLAGVEGAIGTDDNGKNAMESWHQSWPAIKQVVEAVAKNVEAVAGGLSSAADQVFQAEQQTLSAFGRQAVDPRKQPSPGREPGF